MAAIKGFEVSGTIYDNEDETARSGVQNVETSVNGLVSQKIYSEDETDTGKKWIDGKPIYRKVLVATNKGTATSITFPSTIENIDTTVSICGFIKATTGSFAGQQFITPRANQSIRVNTTTGVIEIYDRNSPVNADEVYLTVEYTKTTD